VLLGELRGLLGDAEAWARSEGSDAAAAREALDRCREALQNGVNQGGEAKGLC